MSRQPKVSKKSKIARRKGRRPDGTFRKGTNGRRLTKPSPEDLTGSLSEMILSQVSLRRLAKSVISQAYQGDRGALEQVVKVIEYDKQATLQKSEPDYKKNLSDAQHEALEVLITLANGQYVSETVLLERARAVVQELAPAQEVEEDSEVETPDEPDEGIELEDSTAPAVSPTPAEIMQLGPDDPDRIENRRYQQRVKEDADRLKLYGPQDPDALPVLRKEYRN